MKKIFFLVSLAIISFFPISVFAVGVSPGKIRLGYVRTYTSTTLSFILSRGQTLGFQGFSLQAEGNGSAALRVPTSSIIFNPEDDRRSLDIAFDPHTLSVGHYEPILVITPYVDLPNNEHGQTLVPNLQATISFDVTTTPYLSLSAQIVSLRPATTPNTWRAQALITNNGTEVLDLSGFNIISTEPTVTSTFFFKKSLILLPKEVRYIDELVTTNDTLNPLLPQTIYWIINSSLALHQTGTPAEFNLPNQPGISSKISQTKKIFWPASAAFSLLLIGGGGILYLKLRK